MVRRALLLASSVAAVCLVIAFAAGARGGAGASSGKSVGGCAGLSPRGLFYSKPRALRACGYVVYPLVSITREPIDGEVIANYNYNVNGVISTLTYPPRSFNAMTAPNEVLEALGIPPRPSRSETVNYDYWVSTYGSKTQSSWVTPTPFLLHNSRLPNLGGPEVGFSP